MIHFLQSKHYFKEHLMKKTKKTILLSLTLASSLLHAEDNGVFLSVGYQIGEAVQKVKNADKVQKLSDTYEQLSR